MDAPWAKIHLFSLTMSFFASISCASGTFPRKQASYLKNPNIVTWFCLHFSCHIVCLHSLADLLLDVLHRVFQALGDGVTAQRLDVEAVRLGRENQKGHHRPIGVVGFELERLDFVLPVPVSQ